MKSQAKHTKIDSQSIRNSHRNHPRLCHKSLQNVADWTLGVPATRVRDQLWDHLTTTVSDRDVLGRSCMPTTPGLEAISQSRRADSNRGPLHNE